MKTTHGLVMAVLAAGTLAYACGMSDASSFADDTNKPSDPSAAADGGVGGSTPSDPRVVDDAVILVHAASTQSFRLCFANEGDRQPQPDSKVMPEANVVGVEVGSAVRLGPLRGKPGKVLLFDEPLIRAFYPPGGGKGPTCDQLSASASSLKDVAVDLGVIDTDLSRGVHLLVVTGCPANGPLRQYTVAECGADYDAAKGNLKVREMTLPGVARSGAPSLPAQVVHLAQPLESARTGKPLRVSFGAADAGPRTTVVEDIPLLASPLPQSPIPLGYSASDEGVYAKVGLRVEIGPQGAATTVVEQSLADIQKLSSPTDLPSTYFDGASNYVFLLLGDPSPKLTDGGIDTDPRKNLHFLAVPVVDSQDAGAGDGGDTGDAGDGGVK